MNGNASSSDTKERLLPGFGGAFRGIWLMTWRSQWVPRKLPGQLGMLLIIPFLIYITMVSSESYAHRTVFLGDANEMVRAFARRSQRQKVSIQPETTEALRGILTDEIHAVQTPWQAQPGESPNARQKRLKDDINECYDKIGTRAKALLNESQYRQFAIIAQRNRDNALGKVSVVLVPWNRTEPFYHWLIDFYFFIILPLACVRGCGPLIRDELQADTLGFLITRPVGRARLLIAKYAAQVLSLEIILLLETLLIFAAGAARQVPSLGVLLALVLGVQILVVPVWSALGLLFGQLTARYMALALVYGSVVEFGIGRIPTNINTLSIMRHLQILLNHNDELHHVFSWPADGTAMAICALPVATVLFLSVAVVLFSLIEYHHAGEMQK
jgi:ABC-2 family transporter protein